MPRFAAFAAAFLYYSLEPSWQLFVVMAALTRRKGFLLIGGLCIHLRRWREVRRAAIYLLSAAPAAAWYSYVHARAVDGPAGLSAIPLSAIVSC
jgi:hypothetical protein